MAGVGQLEDCTGLRFTLIARPAVGDAIAREDEAAVTPTHLDHADEAMSLISAAIDGFVTNLPLFEPVGDYISKAHEAPFSTAPILRIYAASLAGFARCSRAWEEAVWPLIQELGPCTEAFAMLNEREKLYVCALELCYKKEFRRAFETYAELLRRFPTDLCAMILVLNPCQFGIATWREVLAIYKDAQERAGWSEEQLPSAFLLIRTFAQNNAGLLHETRAQYERLLAREGDVMRTSHAVHIGAHVKTFTSPASEALRFLEDAAAETRYFTSGKREHLLMHLGALHAFNLDFSTALAVFDRLWDGSGIMVDRSTEEFRWNAVLLLWYVEVSSVANSGEANASAAAAAAQRLEALDGRWGALADLIEASGDAQQPVHGYWALLYAFALRRGGRSGAAEARISWVASQCSHGARAGVGEAALHEREVAAEEGGVAAQWLHDHWCGLTMPLLSGCVAFADALLARPRDAVADIGKHSTLASIAGEAARRLRLASEELALERLGVSDEQRMIFRLSFHAAVLLARHGGGGGEQPDVSAMWETCRAELLESAKIRPLWKLESAWLSAGSASGAAVGGC